MQFDTDFIMTLLDDGKILEFEGSANSYGNTTQLYINGKTKSYCTTCFYIVSLGLKPIKVGRFNTVEKDIRKLIKTLSTNGYTRVRPNQI